MQPNEPRVPVARALIAIVLAVAACSPEPPRPSASHSGPSSSPAAPAKVVGDLALEACDPSGVMPCEQQAVVLIEPIAASGVALTYSTEWADGRIDRPTWNADALGLGGWALDVLQRYDPERRILLSGDGSWRFAEAVDIGDGERAVPTYDGLRYFVFDGAWRHVRTVDSITGATMLAITYDAAGRLSGLRGPNGGSPAELTVQRANDGSMAGLLGASGAGTGAIAPAGSRLAAIGRPDGTLLSVTFGDFGLIANWQATGRGAVSFAWDEAGRLRSATDGDGVSRTLEFASTSGSVTITSTDKNDGTATFRAERSGDVLRQTFTDTDATVTQLETSTDGSTRLVEADGTVTTVGAVAHPRWGLAAPIRTPLVETRPDGTVHRVETVTTLATGTPEPAGGAWQAGFTIDGQRYVEAYDPATRTLTSTDPAGRQGSSTFDSEARLTSQRLPGKAPVAFAYNTLGFLGSVTVGEGATAATTSFGYDTELGEVLATRPDGSTATLRLDGYGTPQGASTGDENVSFLHDAGGAVRQVRPGAHPATSFGYSEAGRQTAFIPPVVGDDTWYELMSYTPAGQVATISDPSGPRIEIAYDAAGRARSWEFDRGTSTVSYDPQSGLLASHVAPGGVTTSFAYDGWVQTGIAWSGPLEGEVVRTVNGLLQPTAETVNGGERIDFGYDPSGLLSSIGALSIERDQASGQPTRLAIGAVVTTNEYDTAGRLVASATTSAGRAVITLRYTRDLLGRVTLVERTDAAGDATHTGFGYDGTGRLSRTERDGVATTYAYDATGNRLTVSRDGKVRASATYDDRDRIVKVGEESFTSSPDGTLLGRIGADGPTTFDFDDLGDLRSVALAGGRRIEYVIDAGGRRIGRSVDGVLIDGFLYDVDDSIVAWTDGSGRVVARFAYDDAGRLAMVRRGGRDFLVVTDQVGSPIAILDSQSGDVVAAATYDAWGNVLEGSVASHLPFGFAGGLVDPDTGLIHFGARDYDPRTGRWTAPDPLRFAGGDINLYRYAAGDPVNNVDPTGTTTCAAAECGATATGPSIARPLPMGGGNRGGSTGGTGGSKAGGTTTGGYHDRAPRRYTQPPEPTRPADVGERNRNSSTLPADHPIPEDYFPEEDSEPWQNCIGPNCRYVPGTNSGYCSGGDCIVRDRGGSYGWCTGWCVFGEPHLVTADSGRIDFQAAGEFVISRSPDGAYEVQARFETSPLVRTVTRTTAIAMRVGSDRVAFYAGTERPIVVNGEAVDRAVYATTLPGGGRVERLGSDAIVTWPDGSTLGVHLYGKFMDFTLAPSDAVARTTTGVLGGQDGDRANDLTTREGVVIDPESPTFRDDLYGPFADGWRTTQAASLFDYLPGESTATFQLLDVPAEHVDVDTLDAQTRARAEALCRAAGVNADPVLAACILDVGMTGDPTYAAAAATVAAALELANVPPLDLGTAIEREQHVTGTLLAGSVDRYHFTAAAGAVVYLDADEACNPAISWRLLRPSGGLTWDSEACTDMGRQVLPESGEWRIEIYSDEAAAGAYGFRVVSAPQPRVQAIAPGGSASGTTTAVGEWHRYTLEATAGQVVYLDAQAACDSPLSWRLLRPNGGLKAFSRACDDLGRQVLDTAGTWVIEAYSEDTDTGAYAFRVIGAPAPRERDVLVDATIADATTQTAEWHRYRLTATKGQVVYLDALGACVPGLSWQLLRPDSSLIAFGTTCTDIGRQVLDTAGDWVIEIYAPEFATGAYSFKVIGAPGVQQKTIKVGQRVEDTIDAIGEWHRYRLTATAGQTIVIDALSDCVADLYWKLLRPDGSLTAFATTCTDSDVRTLDVAGDWVIEVYSDTMVTGAYEFTVKPAP